MLGEGRARAEPVVVGRRATGRSAPHDLDGEVAVELVADDDVGQGEVRADDVGTVAELPLEDVEGAVEPVERRGERHRVAPRGRGADHRPRRPGR